MKYRILSLVKCIVITAHFSVNVNIYFSQLCAAMGIRPASGRVHAPAVPFRGHRGGYSLALYPSRSPSWAQMRLLTGSVPFSLSFVGTDAATHWLCTLLVLLRGHKCGYSLALCPSRSPSWAQRRLLTGSVPFSFSFVGTDAAPHWLCAHAASPIINSSKKNVRIAYHLIRTPFYDILFTQPSVMALPVYS